MGIYEVIGVGYVVFTSALGSAIVLVGFVRYGREVYRTVMTSERRAATLVRTMEAS